MGHCISGFIARFDGLVEAAREIPNGRVCPLPFGLGFLPLPTGPASDGPTAFPQFYLLSEPLTHWAATRSHDFPVAYVETDYFGGPGTQAAVVWHDGRLAFLPDRYDDEDAQSPRRE